MRTDKKPAMPGTMPIGEVARLTGLSVHALRFYEREHLMISEIDRSANGRRRYTTADVEWLRVCVRLRESGMPLTQMRQFASLVRQGPGNEPERLELLRHHEERVRKQMASLRHCLGIIESKVCVYQKYVDSDEAAGIWAPVPEDRADTGGVGQQ